MLHLIEILNMINKRNNLLAGIFVVLFVSLFYSCLDSNDFDEYYYDTANLEAFSLDTSSVCEDLDEYVFYIDNIKNEIYNYDSLPFGTPTSSLVPKFYAFSSNGKAKINGEAYQDGSAYDFSNEVIFENTSSTGKYTKSYSIKVNVHKVNGSDYDEVKMSDFPSSASVHVVKTGSAFYAYYTTDALVKCKYSLDGKIWNDLSLSGFQGDFKSTTILNGKFYAVGNNGDLLISFDGLSWSSSAAASPGDSLVALYGSVKSDFVNADSIMFGLVSKDNELYYAQYKNDIWTIGEKMKDNFPYSNYASTFGKSVTGLEYLYLGFGLDVNGELCKNIWTSQDGLNWISINNVNDDSKLFKDGRINANMFFYENKLVCFGGVKADGSYANGVYESSDRGINWFLSSNWVCNITRLGLQGAASFVEVVGDDDDDNKEFLWLFGGKTSIGFFEKIVKLYPVRMLFD